MADYDDGGDEELSYKSYDTPNGRAADNVPFKDSDEEFAYTRYNTEVSGYGGMFEEEEHDGGYGDFIVEEFSSGTTINRVLHATHLSESTATYVVLWAYFVFGLILSATSLILDEIYEMGIITLIFPFVAGALITVYGLIRLILTIRAKKYLSDERHHTATYIIFIILGIMILADTIVTVVTSAHSEEPEEEFVIWANVFIGVVWGVYGLTEAVRSFNHAINWIVKKQNCAYFIVKGLIELVFSLLLIYNPMEHIALHLVIFGLEIMFSALTHMPFIRRYANRKNTEK